MPRAPRVSIQNLGKKNLARNKRRSVRGLKAQVYPAGNSPPASGIAEALPADRGYQAAAVLEMDLENEERIPVRVIPRAQILSEMQDRLREYEHRYEMSSEEMSALVESDAIRPTSETFRWYHTYCGVQFLLERETLTAGTPGTTTEPFTTAA